MTRFLLFISIVLISSDASAQITPGTYELAICGGRCDIETPHIVARGTLVIFETTLDLAALPDSIRHRLPARLDWVLRQEPPNACFSITQREKYVDGKELYAGITPRALTRWVAGAAGVEISLYQSPDAHYRLAGSMRGNDFIGRGVQGICCGYPPPPETHFEAKRIGPHDVAGCLS